MAACLFPLSVTADSARPSHFQPPVVTSLSQAVTLFSTHNKALAELMAKQKLTPAELSQVHQLTYTLETALERINKDMAALTDALEAVHVASEKLDEQKVRTEGRRYLKVAQTVVR
ncbi:MAG: hypothetical protein Q8K94_01835 [Moraxellaceae bacterium]|nr:hypothetical protein [Moraxellaceae bacterium]